MTSKLHKSKQKMMPLKQVYNVVLLVAVLLMVQTENMNSIMLKVSPIPTFTVHAFLMPIGGITSRTNISTLKTLTSNTAAAMRKENNQEEMNDEKRQRTYNYFAFGSNMVSSELD